MLIRHKLYSNAAFVAASMGVMLALLLYLSNSFTSLNTMVSLAEQLNADTLGLRRHEKDFMARKDLKYFDSFNKEVSELNQRVTEIKLLFEDFDIDTSSLERLQQIVGRYQQKFNALVEAQKVIGLNHKEGLYGGLRKAVHNVEELLSQQQSHQLLADMLQLRRAEKDFMLRLDDKYLAKFNNKLKIFQADLDASDLSSDYRAQVITLLNEYKSQFESLVAAQRQVGFDYKSGLRGELRTTVHQTEETLKQTITSADEHIQEVIDSTTWLSVTLFSIVLAAVVAVTLYILRSVITPIESIRGTINQIRSSNNLTLRSDVMTKDEAGEMAANFNDMVGNFEQLIRDVNSAIEVLNGATGELATNITTTTSDMEKQRDETDMVATAATEMEATIDEIAKKTEHAANKAEETNNQALTGRKDVELTVSNIRQLSSHLNNSSQVVSELAKESETIGSVLDVIRGIAEQTNLLALNAAIEAARAGEQGRGFAVVAEEVRNLAMRTSESTQEITSIIESLQTRTQQIVTLIEESSSQGLESATQAERVGELLLNITEDISNIQDMSTQIATAVEEQSYVAGEVNKNVVRIRDLSEHATVSAQANRSAGDEVAKQAEVLSQAAQRFRVN